MGMSVCMYECMYVGRSLWSIVDGRFVEVSVSLARLGWFGRFGWSISRTVCVALSDQVTSMERRGKERGRGRGRWRGRRRGRGRRRRERELGRLVSRRERERERYNCNMTMGCCIRRLYRVASSE